MSKIFLRLTLVVGIGVTAAACQDAPGGYNQPAAGQPVLQQGLRSASSPSSSRIWLCAQPAGYGYAQPAPNYNQTRYTTVTVTNRGQNGNRDDVVQQQVVCGSQYYDGYRNRTAPRC